MAADAVLLLHLLFIVFAVGGGLLVARWRPLAALHLPAAVWAAWIELSGGVCPLTPLENRLRALAGQAGYRDGFIEHYLLPLVYPAGLTPAVQWTLGSMVVAINIALYAWVLRRARR